jgi:hypothetical protein
MTVTLGLLHGSGVSEENRTGALHSIKPISSFFVRVILAVVFVPSTLKFWSDALVLPSTMAGKNEQGNYCISPAEVVTKR